MARFPKREAEVATLASEIINGLTENVEDFPAPPIPAEALQARLDAYRRMHESAVPTPPATGSSTLSEIWQ